MQSGNREIEMILFRGNNVKACQITMLIMFKWFWTGNNRTQNLVCAHTPWRSNKNQKRCITSAEGFATMHAPASITELNFLRDK